MNFVKQSWKKGGKCFGQGSHCHHRTWALTQCLHSCRPAPEIKLKSTENSQGRYLGDVIELDRKWPLLDLLTYFQQLWVDVLKDSFSQLTRQDFTDHETERTRSVWLKIKCKTEVLTPLLPSWDILKSAFLQQLIKWLQPYLFYFIDCYTLKSKHDMYNPSCYI